MMKIFIKTIPLVLFIAFISQAKTRSTSSGIGIILGNPTGISLKLFDTGQTHFNGAVGWSLDKQRYLYLHGDYIFKRFVSYTPTSDFYLQPYMGFGFRLKTKKDALGFRIPLGIGYDFKSIPMDAFLEIAPTLDLIPATDFDLGIAIAFRYLF